MQSTLPTEHTLDINIIVSPNSAFMLVAFTDYTVVQIWVLPFDAQLCLPC